MFRNADTVSAGIIPYAAQIAIRAENSNTNKLTKNGLVKSSTGVTGLLCMTYPGLANVSLLHPEIFFKVTIVLATRLCQCLWQSSLKSVQIIRSACGYTDAPVLGCHKGHAHENTL